MTAPRLSALIVARNEEARLPDCLASVAFADEIVVVLDRSTDGSAAIAAVAGATIIEGAWELEGERRNAGLAACTGDWMLEVDADERVNAALAAAIRATIATSAACLASGAGRQLCRRPAGPLRLGRLVRHHLGAAPVARGAKRWRAQRVHPGLDWTGREGPQITSGALVHLVDRDISDMLRRLDKYSRPRRRTCSPAATSARCGRMCGASSRAGSNPTVAQGGYREGGWGVLLALCTGAFPLLSYLKAALEPERHGGAS